MHWWTGRAADQLGFGDDARCFATAFGEFAGCHAQVQQIWNEQMYGGVGAGSPETGEIVE
ncbi:hypothetical protein [Burkholderia gladioli]|uniref:hypothetical protein n=1 Tax=Burkholderia gladioli TaxID=28095 RepID=UPI00163E4A1C|nr:hypothetical protein [Burkholderia gladioli]